MIGIAKMFNKNIKATTLLVKHRKKIDLVCTQNKENIKQRSVSSSFLIRRIRAMKVSYRRNTYKIFSWCRIDLNKAHLPYTKITKKKLEP